MERHRVQQLSLLFFSLAVFACSHNTKVVSTEDSTPGIRKDDAETALLRDRFKIEVKNRMHGVRVCYQSYSRFKGAKKGKVVIAADFARNGKMTKLRVAENTTKSKGLGSCVVGELWPINLNVSLTRDHKGIFYSLYFGDAS